MSDVLILQYQQSPKLKGLIDAIDDLVVTQLVEPAEQLEENISVLTAKDIWLDRIGERLDMSRPFINDDSFDNFGFDDAGVGFDQGPFGALLVGGDIGVADDIYRNLILARGAQLITDGSGPSVDEVLQIAFGTGHYIDHQDLTVSIRFDGDFDANDILLILGTGLLTKPAGVRIREIFAVYENNVFGFDANGVGFDQAPFAQIIE